MKTGNLQKVHSGNKLLTGESRGEQREQREREDKDYKTHLARISSGKYLNFWLIYRYLLNLGDHGHVRS